MRKNKSCLLLFSVLFSLASANAQADFAHLIAKGSTGFPRSYGGGAFLEFGLPVNGGDKPIIEPGTYFFGNRGRWVFIFPLLTGYRHTLNGKGYGLYVQPVLGYTAGSTAIPTTTASGQPVTDRQGDTLRQKGNGLTAGLGLGYLFKRLFNDYSCELRYEHIFAAGYPKIAMLSFRFVYTFSLKNK